MLNRQQRRASKAHWKKQSTDAWREWENDIASARPLFEKATSPYIRGIRRFMKNNVYSVQCYVKPTNWGPVDHLMVRRNDEEPVRSWQDLQRIKNELCGAERTAVEVFPAETDLVDAANIYHLWVLPENFVLPFTLKD